MSEQNISSVIPIKEAALAGSYVQTVNARNLHDFLENGDRFTTWIKLRIAKYDFIENHDYVTFSESTEKGRPRSQYAISIDMAKELAMVESNDRGREARCYFIECERRARQIDHHDDPIIVMRVQQIEMEKRVVRLEENQEKLVGLGYMSILAFCNIHGLNLFTDEMKSIGIQLARHCKNIGIELKEIPDIRYGKVRAYPVETMKEWFIDNNYLLESGAA